MDRSGKCARPLQCVGGQLFYGHSLSLKSGDEILVIETGQLVCYIEQHQLYMSQSSLVHSIHSTFMKVYNMLKISEAVKKFKPEYLLLYLRKLSRHQIGCAQMVAPKYRALNQMTVVYGDYNAPCTVKRCTAEFRQSRIRLEDKPWSECPSEAVYEEKCQAVRSIILGSHQINVHQIADTVIVMGINTGLVKMILCKHLLMTKVCT